MAIETDITERKQVEDSLRLNEGRLRLALDVAQMLFWDWMLGRDEISCSEDYGAFFGLPLTGLTVPNDQRMLDPVHPEDRDGLIEAFQHVLATGQELQIEFRGLPRDGRCEWYSALGRVQEFRDGKPLRMIGITRNISQWKNAEDELQRSNEILEQCVRERTAELQFVNDLLQEAQALAQVGHFRWQIDGRVSIWSKELLRIHGLAAGADPPPMESYPARFVYPEDREKVRQALNHAIQSAEPVDFRLEYRINHAGTEEIRWLSSRCRWVSSPDGGRAIEGICQDITEHKLAEDLLRASEQRYRTFVEHATDAFFLHDATGRLIDVNTQACENLGYSREELIGMDVVQFDSQAAGDRRRDIVRRMDAGELVTFDARHRRKDGSTFPVAVQIRRFFLDGRPHAISLAHDITERMRIEEALREGDRHYRALFEQSGVGTAQVDSRTGQFVRVNRRYCELLGYTRAEMLGLNFQAVTFAEDLPADLDNMARLRAGEIPTFQMEQRLLHKNGVPIWVRLTVVPLWEAGTQPDYHLAIVEDISATKQAEQSLRLTQIGLDRAADGFFWIEPSGKIIYVNDSACRVLGYPREELIGKTVPEIDHNILPAAWPAHWEELRRRGSFAFESEHLTKDGRMIQTEVTVNHIRHDGQEFSFAIMCDITERKHADRLHRLAQFSIDRAVDPIHWVGPNGAILYANEATCRMLGYSSDELCSKTIPELSPSFPADDWAGHWAEVKRRGSITFEAEVQTKDGRLLQVEVSINYLLHEGREYHCAIAIDVTEAAPRRGGAAGDGARAAPIGGTLFRFVLRQSILDRRCHISGRTNRLRQRRLLAAVSIRTQ